MNGLGKGLGKRSRLDVEGYLYFIRAGSRGPIKIGWSEKPLTRLAGLQVAHHEELTLVIAVKATRRKEKELHRRFKHAHIRGEWFKPAVDVKRYIEGILSTRAAHVEAMKELIRDGLCKPNQLNESPIWSGRAP